MLKAIFAGTVMLSGFIATTLLMMGRMISVSAHEAIEIAHQLIITLEARHFSWLENRGGQFSGRLNIPFVVTSCIAILGIALCIRVLAKKDKSDWSANRVIVGCAAVLSGIIGTTIIVVGRMIAEASVLAALNARPERGTGTRMGISPSSFTSFYRGHFQIQAPFVVLAVITVLGLALCIWGLSGVCQKPE